MTGARARALEALAVVMILWVSARAMILVGLPHADFVAVATSATSAPLHKQTIPWKHGAPLFRQLDFVSQKSAIPQVTVPSSGRPPQPQSQKVEAKLDTGQRHLVPQPTTFSAKFASEGEAAAPVPPLFAAARTSRRIDAGFWMLWRPDGNGVALGAAGQLGGSQAGLRAVIPLVPDNLLGASLRLSTSFMPSRDRELAPGLSFRPLRRVPVELVLERRLRAGSPAGDATAAFAAGGVSALPVVGIWELDAYGQAGVVGMRRQLWFADGSATARRPIASSVRLGAGLWAGIQPGLKRIDIGPSLSTRLAPDEMGIRLDLDWRIRVAGDARPETGLAITIAKDF